MLMRKQISVGLHIIKRVPVKCRMASSVPIDFSNLPEHRSLVLEKFGDPSESVILKTRKPEQVIPKSLGPKQILVEHLAACINPADINVIQGVYGIRPELPTIVGGEGVTRVKSIGSEITHLKPGDLALGGPLAGYWQSYSVQPGEGFFKLDNDLDVTVATQLRVNPCTAYRMINDFYSLKPGDTIIQNGANSAVGVYVIQLAKLWGYKTINVIRDRPNKAEVIKELKDFGADYVITEAEVGDIEMMKPILKEIGKPKLFLNCVGGKNAINCQKSLDYAGYSVTYGAMSRQPFSVAATSLIFKDHKYVGFWVSRWFEERESSKRHEISAMLDEISTMFKQGVLIPKSTTFIDFADRDIAFSGSNNTKYVFLINKR